MIASFISKLFFKSFTLTMYLSRWLERVVFYKHYNFSHNNYLREKYKKRWDDFFGNLVYHLDLEDVYSNQKVVFSKLYLKPVRFNRNEVIEVDFSLIVRCNKTEYIHPIKHKFYNDNIAVFTLTSIPLKELIVTNDYIFTSFDTYFFQINQINVNDNIAIKNLKSKEYDLLYFEELNGEFIKKWGSWWNLTLYKRAKNEFKLAIAASFLEDAIFLHGGIKMSFSQNVRVMVVKFLLISTCQNFIFWASLVLNLSRVTNDGRLKSKYFSVWKLRKIFIPDPYGMD